MPRSSPVLAPVEWGLLVDHFVAVLAVSDTHVTVGDPILGKVTYGRADFEARWRFMGIVLERDAAGEIPSDSSGASVNTTLTPA